MNREKKVSDPGVSKERNAAPEQLPMAFVLAGGRGRRLGPLTERMPKPLLPVGGKPLIISVLEDLIRNGVKKAVILTGYLAKTLEEEVISFSLPIELRFLAEERPLGSAGGVRRALDCAEKEFFVVCADACGRRDYRGFYDRFRKSGAEAGMLLSRVKDPREFGLVLTDPEGYVSSFVEKPSWSQVCTDRVNTGVYLFRKEALRVLPEKSPCDFARDLFPQMLASGKKIAAYDDGLFWCDVGDPAAYLSCALRENGGRSVIGKGCELGGASVADSVLFDGVKVGKNSRIEGAIVMRGAVIGKNCFIRRGCLVGENCTVEDGSSPAEGSVLPSESVYSGTETGQSDLRGFLYENVLRAPSGNARFFTQLGQSLVLALSKCGNDARCALPGGQKLSVIYHAEAQNEARFLLGGAGNRGEDKGAGFFTCASYEAYRTGSAAVFLEKDRTGSVGISFFDGLGLPPPTLFTRELRDAYGKICAERNTEPDPENALSGRAEKKETTGSPSDTAALNAYGDSLSALCPGGLSGMTVRVTAHTPAGVFFMKKLLSLGAALGGGPKALHVRLFDDGKRCTVSDAGARIDFWHAAALLNAEEMKKGGKILCLPERAPEALFRASSPGVRTVRGFPLVPCDGSYDEARAECAHRRWLFDGLAAALGVLSLLHARQCDCRELLCDLPGFSVVEEIFDCAGEEKLRVLLSANGEPSLEGVRLEASKGKLRLRALGGRGVSLFAEAAEENDARSILNDLEKLLKNAAR